MTRVEIARALYDGQDAAADGVDVTACPYPPGSLLATAWARGYGMVRERMSDAIGRALDTASRA
jgi:hypothetical protein